ncbi:MAG: hypothetical protein ABGY72_09175, partial [bacterium]
GLKAKTITPEAKLANEPWSARPTSKPALVGWRRARPRDPYLARRRGLPGPAAASGRPRLSASSWSPPPSTSQEQPNSAVDAKVSRRRSAWPIGVLFVVTLVGFGWIVGNVSTGEPITRFSELPETGTGNWFSRQLKLTRSALRRSSCGGTRSRRR